MEAFERDAGHLLQVYACNSASSLGLFFSHASCQNLFHMTAEIIEEHAAILDGVDLLVDSQGISCSDELLLQMKDWYSLIPCFTWPLSVNVADFVMDFMS